MNDIHWIYLVDYTGTPILIYLNDIKEINEPNFAVISNFLFGIREINKNLEDNKLNKTEINQKYFFFIEEKEKEFFIVLKSDKVTFIENILNILLKVKDSFMEVFHMNEVLAQEKKIELLEEFRKEIKDLIENNISQVIKKKTP
ncbi:MAG: hypothetical protein KGD57_06790 [Candidatus Lokiarchaeota archaeon]|nr:hypothetical protein [Candidatus Lokiarchaeota archaeon]